MDDAQPRSIRDTFDAVADGHAGRALRFLSDGAAHMVGWLRLRGDEKVLDVACGTGHASLALARLLPHGRVTAVDFAPGMLAHARRKARAAGLDNLEFVERDMQALDWQGKFDVAVCAFGIFFAEDMSAQLRRIADTVKPGGRVMSGSFAKDYMQPPRSLMVARLGRFSVPAPPQTWLRIAEPQGCRGLLGSAGLRDVEVEAKNLGYFLASAEEWWQVVWNAALRRMLGRLSLPDQAHFEAQRLARIEALRTPDGIWMDIPVLFTIGSKPGSDG